MSSINIKRIGKVILVMMGIAILLLLGGYLLLHSYYTKMKIDDGSYVFETEGVVSDNDICESEDIDITEPDSTAEDIDALEESICNNMEESAAEFMEDKNVFNILLIGCDSRQAGGRGRSDSMILLSINKTDEELIATSIMRDIYVQIPEHGYNRINAAYAYGGAQLLIQTIEQNFKIQIDRYVSVDFFVFMDIVNQVNGVNIEVSDAEVRVMNRYINELNGLLGEAEGTDCLFYGGSYLLNGKQALGYSRIRYVGNADFERTQRQRRVLEQIFQKVKDCNLIELNQLLNTILPEVTTDLTEGEVISLALEMNDYRKYELKQYRVPYDNTWWSMRIRGMAVLGIDFETNIENMKRDIY